MLHSFASTKRAKNHQGNIFIVRTVGCSDLIAYALFPRANIPSPPLPTRVIPAPLRNRLYHSCEKYVRRNTVVPDFHPTDSLSSSSSFSPFIFATSKEEEKSIIYSRRQIHPLPRRFLRGETRSRMYIYIYIPERAPTPILERRPFSKSNRPGERA